jgi:hypothetical protein
VGSIPRRYWNSLMEADACGLPVPPQVSHAKRRLGDVGWSVAMLTWPNAKRGLKTAVWRAASSNWAACVQGMPELAPSYAGNMKLEIRPYLKLDNFRGRRLLTKLRIDDLPLTAASYRTEEAPPCPLCNGEEETRPHFLIRCPALRTVRDMHSSALPWLDSECDLPERECIRRLLLVGIDQAALTRVARQTGNYCADLWIRRGELTPEETFYRYGP